MRMTAGRMLAQNSRGGERGSRVILQLVKICRELWEICRSVTAGVLQLSCIHLRVRKRRVSEHCCLKRNESTPQLEAWTQKGHFVEYLSMRNKSNTLKWDLENVTADVWNTRGFLQTKYVLFLYRLSCSVDPDSDQDPLHKAYVIPFFYSSHFFPSFSCSYGTPTSRALKTLCLDTWNLSITVAFLPATPTSPPHPVTAAWRSLDRFFA